MAVGSAIDGLVSELVKDCYPSQAGWSSLLVRKTPVVQVHLAEGKRALMSTKNETPAAVVRSERDNLKRDARTQYRTRVSGEGGTFRCLGL